MYIALVGRHVLSHIVRRPPNLTRLTSPWKSRLLEKCIDMFLCNKKAHGKHGRSLKCDITIVTLYLGINEAWGSGSLVKLVSAEYERNGNSLSDLDRFGQSQQSACDDNEKTQENKAWHRA